MHGWTILEEWICNVYLFQYQRRSAWIWPLILTVTHFSVFEILEFSIEDFGILFLSHTGRPKFHHESLFLPRGQDLPTILLKGHQICFLIIYCLLLKLFSTILAQTSCSDLWLKSLTVPLFSFSFSSVFCIISLSFFIISVLLPMLKWQQPTDDGSRANSQNIVYIKYIYHRQWTMSSIVFI